MGEAGCYPHHFLYEMDMRMANAFIEGYRRKQNKAWEIARWQTWITSVSWGCKARTPHDFFPFPFDAESIEEEEEEKLSPEEEQRRIKELLADCRRWNEEQERKQQT